MGMTKAERLAKQEQRFFEMQKYEKEIREKGFTVVAGVDEVGRGPLAGPVVAACVALPPDFDVRGIDDSKKLSEKKREALFDEIREKAWAVGVGFEDNTVIDEINILEATKSAMKKAIISAEVEFIKKYPGHEIEFVIFDAMEIPEIGKEQMSLVKGDAKSISVAAASIIAKVTRDRLMVGYDEVYPGYKFASNKGYGTKDHYNGLRELGLTPIHRKSFLKNFQR